MTKLIAIGGGHPDAAGGFPRTGTASADREIVKQAGKKNPELFFIPTASKDSQSYIDAVEAYFGKRLGCKIGVLKTVNQKISSKIIKEKILHADIIYVGGGNTLYMMRKWQTLGIGKILLQAYKKDVVMSGLSSGAICWFRYGTSDSRMLTDPTFREYIRASGLGWFDLTMSPHRATEKKRKPGLIRDDQKIRRRWFSS